MWPLLIMAALSTYQAKQKADQEKRQAEADSIAQASQQANSGYTHQKPEAAHPSAPMGLGSDLATAGAGLFSQYGALQDQQQREDLAKLYQENLRANTSLTKAKQNIWDAMGPQAAQAAPTQDGVQTPWDEVINEGVRKRKLTGGW